MKKICWHTILLLVLSALILFFIYGYVAPMLVYLNDSGQIKMPTIALSVMRFNTLGVFAIYLLSGLLLIVKDLFASFKTKVSVNIVFFVFTICMLIYFPSFTFG